MNESTPKNFDEKCREMEKSGSNHSPFYLCFPRGTTLYWVVIQSMLIKMTFSDTPHE